MSSQLPSQHPSTLSQHPVALAQAFCRGGDDDVQLAAQATYTYNHSFRQPNHFSTSPAPPPRTTANMTSTIGIPIKLLNEAQGHIVTLELDNGTTYRGKLIEGAPLRLPPFAVLQTALLTCL